jgi:hypothetical protein
MSLLYSSFKQGGCAKKHLPPISTKFTLWRRYFRRKKPGSQESELRSVIVGDRDPWSFFAIFQMSVSRVSYDLLAQNLASPRFDFLRFARIVQISFRDPILIEVAGVGSIFKLKNKALVGAK